MFRVFKNHQGDHIIYDTTSRIFYKHALPNKLNQLQAFRDAHTHFVILRQTAEDSPDRKDCFYFYNEIAETATTVRPDTVPERWDKNEYYIEPYNSIRPPNIDVISKCEYFNNSQSTSTLLNLTQTLPDWQIGHIFSNFTRHNQLRFHHENTPPFILDAELCVWAQQRAERLLAGEEDNDHGHPEEYGENVFYASSKELAEDTDGVPGRLSESTSGAAIAQRWYDEIEDYCGEFSEETAHFTQVVWQDSFFVGIGCAEHDGVFYSVALYYPPGNVFDEERPLKVTNLRKNNLKGLRTVDRSSMQRKSSEIIPPEIDDHIEGTRRGSIIEQTILEPTDRSEHCSGDSGEDCLIKAVSKGDLDSMQELYDRTIKIGYSEHGKNRRTIGKYMQEWVNTADSKGWAAIHHAVRHSNFDVIDKLLDFEADPMLKTPPNGTNSLHIAVQCKESFDIATQFLSRIEELEAGMVEKMLNSVDDRGLTPLSLAVYFKADPRTISYLLENGANPELESDKFGTAFSISCDKYSDATKNAADSDVIQKRLDIVRLLAAYCNVNAISVQGWTVLAKAVCAHRNPQLVKVLLEDCRVKPNQALSTGETPLILACQISKREQIVKEMVELLKKHGADPDVTYEYNGGQYSAKDWLKRRKYTTIEL